MGFSQPIAQLMAATRLCELESESKNSEGTDRVSPGACNDNERERERERERE